MVDRGSGIGQGTTRRRDEILAGPSASGQRPADDGLSSLGQLDAVCQLAGGVAHDFNNLLTVILGNAETLGESLTHLPRLQAMAEASATAARRGAELVHCLLAFAGCLPLAPERVDAGRLVAGMDSLIRRTLTGAIDVELVRQGDLWPVEVDPVQLELAIVHLAMNARDAMPQGGRLTIETGNVICDEISAGGQPGPAPGRHVAIALTDTGHGMDGKTASQAFAPFFTTNGANGSSGLGLSMVHGFTRQSRGHVDIRSSPGEGTRVTLYFPAAVV